MSLSREPRTALLLAALCALSWLTFAWATVRQCSREGMCYQGRSLTEWSRDLSASPPLPTSRRLTAVDALAHYGTSAVPALITALHDPTPEVRQRAIGLLARIGPNSGEVGPALVEVLKQTGGSAQASDAAVEALVTLGPAAIPAIPALQTALTDPNREVAVRAADALARMEAGKPSWPLVLGTLEEILDNGSPPVRLRAVHILGGMGRVALPAFVRAVKDPDPDVRRSVVESLGRLGPNGIPALTVALADPDVSVRRLVPGALVPSGSPAVPALMRALDDSAAEVRVEAAQALRELGPAGLEAVPALRRHAARDPAAVVRAASVMALAQVGPFAGDVRPDLKRVASDDADPMVRRSAEEALRTLGGP